MIKLLATDERITQFGLAVTSLQFESSNIIFRIRLQQAMV